MIDPQMRHLLPYLCLTLLTACPRLMTPEPSTPEAQALREASARWERVRPTGDSYALIQRRVCFCMGSEPMRVTVTRGRITAVVHPETGEALPPDAFTWYRTVDQLFAEVRRAIEQPPAEWSVQYHPTQGYPTRISLDPVQQIADDEITWETELAPPR